jgi:hypothetical protein
VSSYSPPVTLPVKESLPLVKDSAVSPQALALFRLLERLSRRTGYACVKLLETLAAMLEKSVRAVRYALAELIAAGWIGRKQSRRGGVSKLFFWPLVRLAPRSRGLFSGRPVAGCVAGYSPSKLQVTPSTPYKTSPVGTKTTTDTVASTGKPAEALPVVVSSLREVVSEPEALELAREAAKLEKSPEQVRRAVQALQAQAARVFNRGGWLREALRRGFNPPASGPRHSSDMKPGSEPIKNAPVTENNPSFYRPAQTTSQTSESTTQGRERFREKREALTRGEATEAPSSLLPDPGKTSASVSGTARPADTSTKSAGTPAPSQSSPAASVRDDAAFMASLTSEQLREAKERYLARIRVPDLRNVAAESLEKHGLSTVGLIAAARELFG